MLEGEKTRKKKENPPQNNNNMSRGRNVRMMATERSGAHEKMYIFAVGCTFGGLFIPSIYSHARWELP